MSRWIRTTFQIRENNNFVLDLETENSITTHVETLETMGYHIEAIVKIEIGFFEAEPFNNLIEKPNK